MQSYSAQLCFYAIYDVLENRYKSIQKHFEKNFIRVIISFILLEAS